MRRTALISITTILLFPLVAFGIPAGASASPGSTMAAKAFSDARASSWVHEEISDAISGTISESANFTAGTTSAAGTLSVGSPSAATNLSFIDLDSANQVYIEGPAPVLTSFDSLTFTPTVAAQYANEWIEMLPSDSDYNQLSGITVASEFSGYTLTGRVTLGSVVTRGGQKVRAITGTLSGTGKATLYVTDSARPLPVSLNATSGNVTVHISWDTWNEGSTPAAPPSSVPFPAVSTTTTTTTPPVTTPTTSVSANFCADIAATNAAVPTTPTSGATTTKARELREIIAARKELPAAYALVVAVINTSPTPAIAAAYTQELGYLHSLGTTLVDISTALKKLSPKATSKEVNATIAKFEGPLITVIFEAAGAIEPVASDVAAYCPSATTTP